MIDVNEGKEEREREREMDLIFGGVLIDIIDR